MIRWHTFLWPSVGFVVLAGVLCGCDSTPPVAETPPAPVSVSQPLAREIVDHDDYEGRIAAVEMVEVRARVRGHLIKVSFQDGQIVNKGDPLFEIDARPYQTAVDSAEAQKAAAEASLELAKKEYNRNVRMAASGASSREELDVWTAKQSTAISERVKAVAALEQAKLDIAFTKI